MPLYLAYKLHIFKYDSDKFVEWYLKLPDLAYNYKKGPKSWKYRFVYLSAYYFWIVYVLACYFVGLSNVFVAILSLIISPFVVGGFVYCEAYFFNYLRRINKFINK